MILLPICFKTTLRVRRSAGAAEVVGRQGSSVTLPLGLTWSSAPHWGDPRASGSLSPTQQVPWVGADLLRWGSSLAFMLRGAARTPWLQHHLSPLVGAEGPAGSSHSEPLARPCLYLTLQQRVFKPTSFPFDSRNDEGGCFLVRKLYSSSNDRKGGTALSTDSICAVGKSIQGLSGAARMWGSRCLKGHKIYLVSISLFLFDLTKPALLLSHLSLGFLAKIQKKPCALFLPPPSPRGGRPCQRGLKVWVSRG